ncbi:MAG TPA: hypothetical protein VGM10_07410 [Actinocrinis sp.]
MPKSNAEKLGIAPGSTLSVLNVPAGDAPVLALMPAFVELGWHGVSLVSLDAVWSAARFRRLEQIRRR